MCYLLKVKVVFEIIFILLVMIYEKLFFWEVWFLWERIDNKIRYYFVEISILVEYIKLSL